MSKKTQNNLKTQDLRETLKTMMYKEFEKLPETLEAMQPADRLNFICKLMPFVLPKNKDVHPTFGEKSGLFNED